MNNASCRSLHRQFFLESTAACLIQWKFGNSTFIQLQLNNRASKFYSNTSNYELCTRKLILHGTLFVFWIIIDFQVCILVILIRCRNRNSIELLLNLRRKLISSLLCESITPFCNDNRYLFVYIPIIELKSFHFILDVEPQRCFQQCKLVKR